MLSRREGGSGDRKQRTPPTPLVSGRRLIWCSDGAKRLIHHHSRHKISLLFFTSRVENVRNMTQSAPPPQYRDVSVTQLSSFDPVTPADVSKLIHDTPNKQSWLDPLPMWLLKECSDLLSPFLSALCNSLYKMERSLHRSRQLSLHLQLRSLPWTLHVTKL